MKEGACGRRSFKDVLVGDQKCRATRRVKVSEEKRRTGTRIATVGIEPLEAYSGIENTGSRMNQAYFVAAHDT